MVVDGDQSELLTAPLPIPWKLRHLEDNWDLLFWVTWCLAAQKTISKTSFTWELGLHSQNIVSLTLQTFLS